jgi:alkaline phosphatase D
VGNEQLDWIENEVITNNTKWNIFGNQLLIAEKDMGWNRWPGFPQDRKRLLKLVEEDPTKNFVVTTGNAHNLHHYVVFNEDKTDTLFHELLPGSISSGNNGEKARYDSTIIANEDKRLREADNVLWFHQGSHEFIVLDATSEKLQADWYFVSDIRKKEYELSKPYSLILKPN